mmetsp:Transcript_45917/g.97940  ORF Transcript_45917/g.97940 Transcript_45917/m.97940 type:complete len:213 (+) Transcript_45917:224-862(+)
MPPNFTMQTARDKHTRKRAPQYNPTLSRCTRHIHQNHAKSVIRYTHCVRTVMLAPTYGTRRIQQNTEPLDPWMEQQINADGEDAHEDEDEDEDERGNGEGRGTEVHGARGARGLAAMHSVPHARQHPSHRGGDSPARCLASSRPMGKRRGQNHGGSPTNMGPRRRGGQAEAGDTSPLEGYERPASGSNSVPASASTSISQSTSASVPTSISA